MKLEGVNAQANGAIGKLNEGGHYNAVADVRLRIAHFDNPDLVRIEPAALENADVPGKAYEKFLEQYRSLYEPLQTPETAGNESEPVAAGIVEPPEPDIVVENPEPEPVPDVIEGPGDEGGDILPVIEELWDVQPLGEWPEVLDIIV